MSFTLGFWPSTQRGNWKPISRTDQTTATSGIADTLASGTLPKNGLGIPGDRSTLEIKFYSQSQENDVVPVKVVLWRIIDNAEGGTGAKQFSPQIIFDGTVTIGTATGVATGVVTNSYRYADTITTTKSISEVSVHSPEDNTHASLALDHRGAAYVSVYFEPLDVSEPCNALVRFY